MKIAIINDCLRTFICFVLITAFSTSVLASVKYTFVVSEQPAEDFFKPLVAEMILSDAAVAAGEASNGQIESLVFGGGSTMQETNRIPWLIYMGRFMT